MESGREEERREHRINLESLAEGHGRRRRNGYMLWEGRPLVCVCVCVCARARWSHVAFLRVVRMDGGGGFCSGVCGVG